MHSFSAPIRANELCTFKTIIECINNIVISAWALVFDDHNSITTSMLTYSSTRHETAFLHFDTNSARVWSLFSTLLWFVSRHRFSIVFNSYRRESDHLLNGFSVCDRFLVLNSCLSYKWILWIDV